MTDRRDDIDHKVVADAAVERDGTFEALVASFDTLDRAGDIIRPGAFLKSLDAWRQRARRIPVVWSHQTHDPALVIGSVDPRQTYELPEGLVVKGRLNIDHNAAAEHIYDLLKQGDIDSWSFGYRVIRSRRLDSKRTELLELELLELGPTATPANAEARTLAVKGWPLSRREPDRTPSHAELELDLFVAGILDSPARLRTTTSPRGSRKDGFHENVLDRRSPPSDYALRDRAACLGVLHPSYAHALPDLLDVGIIPSWVRMQEKAHVAAINASARRTSTRLGRPGL